MMVGGVNIEGKFRGNNFPQIKKKPGPQSQNNQGNVIFDSHFESGNLLYAYHTPHC